jgi:cytidylate kinase
LVVAIDGPAGAGKSTVARGVARALGVDHIDTGAMYRALTWRALRDGADPSDGPALARLARRMEIAYRTGSELVVDGRRVRREIRTPRVTRFVSQVAAHPEVRRELVRRQRQIARSRDAVIEGRDIGTVVCPDAPVKVFLTASAGERARRRHRELVRSGTPVTLRSLRRELVRRDTSDATRAASPLTPARDAVVIDSTGRTPRQIVAEIVALVRHARGGA